MLKLLLAGLFGFLCLSTPATALAESEFGKPESIITEINLGTSSFSLSTDRPAIPSNGSYLYTVEIHPGADLLSVNLHFQLMREEDGWAFHYFGDSIYIEREDDSDVEGAQNNQSLVDFPPEDTAVTQRGNEVIRHTLQRRSADNLDGLGMHEGVYYVAVIVTANTTAGSESATLRDILTVYDPDQPKLDLMPVVQLSALPSRNAQGTFFESPARGIFEERRAVLEALCHWIIDNPSAQLSLAVSPLFIEDLSAASQGFSYYVPNAAANAAATSNGTPREGSADTTSYAEDDSEGVLEPPAVELRQLTAESEVAQNSLRTLRAVQSAHATGRLTLTAQGYADPNYTVLDILELTDDLGEHYLLGQATMYELLAIEPAAVTVPWTTQLSSSYLDAVVDFLPQLSPQTSPQSTDPTPQTSPRIIVDTNIEGFHFPTIWTERSEESSFVLEDASVVFGAGTEEIIVADASLSLAMSSEASRAQYIDRLFDARQRTPLVPLLVRVHDDMSPVVALLDNLELLSRYSWVNMLDGQSSIDADSTPLLFSAPRNHPQSISDEVLELQAARQAFAGLAKATYEFEDNEQQVDEFAHYSHLSLALFAGPGIELDRAVMTPGGIASSAAFPYFDLSSPAPECLNLAREVQDYVDLWFDDIEIHAQPITFSGSGGILPITVINNSNQTFFFDVRYNTPGQNLLVIPNYDHHEFPTGEWFFEPSVELRNIVSGSVDIQLWAGNHLVAEESVRVSATYADRIAIIVVVVLAGTGLAFYVWKRARTQAHAQSEPNPQEESL